MSGLNKSSLAIIDHTNYSNNSTSSANNIRNPRNKSLFKKFPGISKQHLVEHRMFGSKRGQHGKDFGLSRKFRKGMSSKLDGDMKSSAISPSVEEFDKMMSNVVTKNKSSKKMFNKKY